MELNDTSNDSEWMKSYSKPLTDEELQIQANKNKTFITHPIIDRCCANPHIMVTNDGNKTQKCMNCGYYVSHK
jgi:hypothetical protein